MKLDCAFVFASLLLICVCRSVTLASVDVNIGKTEKLIVANANHTLKVAYDGVGKPEDYGDGKNFSITIGNCKIHVDGYKLGPAVMFSYAVSGQKATVEAPTDFVVDGTNGQVTFKGDSSGSLNCSHSLNFGALKDGKFTAELGLAPITGPPAGFKLIAQDAVDPSKKPSEPTSDKASSSGLSVGAIVGIVIGSILLLVLIGLSVAFGIFVCYRNHRMVKHLDAEEEFYRSGGTKVSEALNDPLFGAAVKEDVTQSTDGKKAIDEKKK